MSTNTKIPWCHHTFNPWRGCRKVAPECANCYITTTVPFRTTGQRHGPVRVRAGAAKFDWIIFGGESGSKARLCNPEWIRDGVAFCRAHGIAPFVKQMGGNLPESALAEFAQATGVSMHDRKGGDPLEWPEDLRVREFPTEGK